LDVTGNLRQIIEIAKDAFCLVSGTRARDGTRPREKVPKKMMTHNLRFKIGSSNKHESSIPFFDCAHFF